MDGPVKTDASGATVPVPAPLVTVLVGRRAQQLRSRLAAHATMLRHSRLATTADLYTHVLHEVQRSGSDRIGDLLTEHRMGSVAASKP